MSRSAISRSATLVALARTHLTWLGVVDDPQAARLLPGRRRAAAALLRRPGFRRFGRTPTFAYLAARTLFYDDVVRRALDAGVRQVVVLAAGYDSRAWRLARPGVTFFEVDQPATQADKRARAPEGGPVYVAADLTDPAWADALVAAGFRPGQATLFTVEGLTMYLTGDQVTALLKELAALGGPDSRLGVNFGVGFEDQGSARGRVGRRVMAAGGEQFRFRLRLEDAETFLAATGWAATTVLAGPGLGRRYLHGTRLAGVPLPTGGFVAEAAAASG